MYCARRRWIDPATGQLVATTTIAAGTNTKAVPPITKDLPDFRKFLPWGPFYGVFVRRDTPADVTATLVKAFKTAAENPQFVQLMKDRGNVPMSTSGAEADAFLKKWQSVTAWVLQDVGAAKASPEKFGIPKP